MQPRFVHEWFSETAATHAAQSAIDTGERTITYAELDDLSSAIASRLLSSGAKGGDVVAILTSDRPAVISSMIGCLKAGCAFVPTDPGLPANRIEAIVRQARSQEHTSELQQ